MTSIISSSNVSGNLAYTQTAKKSLSNRKNDEEVPRIKLIVDKEIGNTRINGIHESIVEALLKAQNGTTIKITTDLYQEQLVITKPNITLEPKEKGGEVTFQQSENPCVVVDVGDGNSCTINNIRMLLRGPNRDMNPTTFSVDM